MKLLPLLPSPALTPSQNFSEKENYGLKYTQPRMAKVFPNYPASCRGTQEVNLFVPNSPPNLGRPPKTQKMKKSKVK